MAEDIGRVPPVMPSHWNGAGKYTFSLGFEGGSICIYGAGFGRHIGDGYFCFKEDDLEWEQDDGPVYRVANVENSELIALRDHLNKLFPPPIAQGPSQ